MSSRNRLEELLDTNQDYANASHLVDVEGLSTPRVCNLLNDMVRGMDPEHYYLEIGTWKGLTLCSAIHANQGKRVIACDKFRLWGRWTGWGVLARRALFRNVAREEREGGAKVTFHHMTSKELFQRELVPKDSVEVYFYDGDHSYEGTYHGVIAAAPCLTQQSYLLMDDWNDEVIQKATFDACEEAKLKIAWMRELEGDNLSQDGWWNGLGVFFLEKQA